MNQDSKTSKELKKVKRKMKPIQTLSDIIMSSLQCFKILKIHQKDLNQLFEDISILKEMKLWNNAGNG
jgi:hypothetical protein